MVHYIKYEGHEYPISGQGARRALRADAPLLLKQCITLEADLSYARYVAKKKQARCSKLEKTIEILQHQVDSYGFCPDCRDKIKGDSCLRCELQALKGNE